ncbi:MAG: transglutaminase family protein [Erythrobacter sp.]|uniref:transglutaminase family protein n=1 Tax=Erythrobacter sp. TaxID=1042 RepID=UPI0026106CDE|nr:transglutaminase family protein [Erythrobacter sp.]MDJ0979682.1 transglutaminase family protein [Erythrobacter sp.]
MRYAVRHVSELAYASPVSRARFNLRLSPRLRRGQTLESESLRLTPAPATREIQRGPYWVTTTQVRFEAPLKTLEVTSEFTIELAPSPLPQSGSSLAQLRAQVLAAADLSDLAPVPYLFASRIATMDPAITAWAAPYLACETEIIAAATSLMNALYTEFTYSPGKTSSSTPPELAFKARHGVCQDFTHVMIMALRAHGVPAAYVSGYLLTRPPPGKAKLVGADAMHAWVDVWCGRDLGWVGFDPTNNRLVGEDHIAIAMGRDYADISPIDGTFIGGAPQTMKSAVDVERIA